MAIPEDESLTYQTLIDQAKSVLLNLVQNKDGYSASVPAESRPGWSYTWTINREGGRVDTNKPCYFVTSLGTDNKLNTVTSETIISEFTQFMTDRGITAKASTPVTTRGLINFFNNFAAFCKVKVIYVATNFGAPVAFYNTVDNNFDSVPGTEDDERVFHYDMQNMVDTLNNTIANVSKLYFPKYATSSSSSCSSSSCSSSCSSSSSSSCSSTYIAYFNLN